MDNIIKTNQIIYYQNLLKEDIDNDIKKKIKKKIKSLNNDNISDSDNITKSTYLNNSSEDYYFYKPWNKLAKVHKIIKIKEFVNNLQIDNKKKRKNLINILKEAIESKKLTKKNSVNYSVEKAKIISIPKLCIKKNSYLLL